MINNFLTLSAWVSLNHEKPEVSEVEALKKMLQIKEIQSQVFCIPSGHFRF